MRAESQSQRGEAGESICLVISLTRSFMIFLFFLAFSSLDFVHGTDTFWTDSSTTLQNSSEYNRSKLNRVPIIIFVKLDQNNLAFNIHEIPSTISLETPSERSGSRQGLNHEQNINLPNGNLLRETILNISPTLTNEPDEAQQPNYRSKLTITEPRGSICWYQIFIVDFISLKL